MTGEGNTLGTIKHTSGTPFNDLIADEVAVTDGTPNFRPVAGPITENRRLISGLVINAVPEPGSLALVCLGGLGVCPASAPSGLRKPLNRRRERPRLLPPAAATA